MISSSPLIAPYLSSLIAPMGLTLPATGSKASRPLASPLRIASIAAVVSCAMLGFLGFAASFFACCASSAGLYPNSPSNLEQTMSPFLSNAFAAFFAFFSMNAAYSSFIAPLMACPRLESTSLVIATLILSSNFLMLPSWKRASIASKATPLDSSASIVLVRLLSGGV